MLSSNVSKSANYVLVWVCCHEKQAQSLIASLYSKNRKTPIPLPDRDLDDYLFEKLKCIDINEDQAGFRLASFDHEGLSVRGLVSNRSGNGKSLFVKKLCESIGSPGDKYNYKIIRIKSSRLNMEAEIEKLLEFTLANKVFKTFSSFKLFI